MPEALQSGHVAFGFGALLDGFQGLYLLVGYHGEPKVNLFS